MVPVRELTQEGRAMSGWELGPSWECGQMTQIIYALRVARNDCTGVTGIVLGVADAV